MKKGFAPLTEATYLILLSLVKPLHGYGIMQKVEIMSDRRVKMGPGTLYGGLSGLVEKKMIKRLQDEVGEERKKKGSWLAKQRSSMSKPMRKMDKSRRSERSTSRRLPFLIVWEPKVTIQI